MDWIVELFRHLHWADARVWTAVFNLPGASPDAALKERLVHIHLVQHAFIHVWRGESFDYAAAESEQVEPASIARWGRQFHVEVARYLDGLDESLLDQTVQVPWEREVASRFDREIASPTLRETLIQVAMHSAYHRGQVGTRLRELGGEPPLTDFIAWIWLGKPAPEWPEITP